MALARAPSPRIHFAVSVDAAGQNFHVVMQVPASVALWTTSPCLRECPGCYGLLHYAIYAWVGISLPPRPRPPLNGRLAERPPSRI